MRSFVKLPIRIEIAYSSTDNDTHVLVTLPKHKVRCQLHPTEFSFEALCTRDGIELLARTVQRILSGDYSDDNAFEPFECERLA